MNRAWRDGTSTVAFEPLDFMAKLAALVPRPRQNTLRYHGSYAPNARLRSQFVVTQELPARRACSCGPETPTPETFRGTSPSFQRSITSRSWNPSPKLQARALRPTALCRSNVPPCERSVPTSRSYSAVRGRPNQPRNRCQAARVGVKSSSAERVVKWRPSSGTDSVQVKQASLAEAREKGRPIQYLDSPRTNREALARDLLARHPVEEGLICVLTGWSRAGRLSITNQPSSKNADIDAVSCRSIMRDRATGSRGWSLAWRARPVSYWAEHRAEARDGRPSQLETAPGGSSGVPPAARTPMGDPL